MVPQFPPIPCPDCPSELRLVRNNGLKNRQHPYVYLCRSAFCAGKLMANPDGSPAGVPAPANIRKMRSACHEVFDRLWFDIHALPEYSRIFHSPLAESDRMTKYRRDLSKCARRRAYCYMAFQLGLSLPGAHLGHITCPDVLRRFHATASAASAKIVLKWWKAGGRKIYRQMLAEG